MMKNAFVLGDRAIHLSTHPVEPTEVEMWTRFVWRLQGRILPQ